MLDYLFFKTGLDFVPVAGGQEGVSPRKRNGKLFAGQSMGINHFSLPDWISLVFSISPYAILYLRELNIRGIGIMGIHPNSFPHNPPGLLTHTIYV